MTKDDLEIYMDEFHRRIIALNPIYILITGSATAGILLSQILYLERARKAFNGDKEFFKTDADLCEETHLTLYELKSAKKKLTDLGIISIIRKGIPAKSWYTVDKSVLFSLITSYGKSQQLVVDNPNNCLLTISTTTTKTTTKITPDKKYNKKILKEDFKRFWDAYPKRVAKESARKAFEKAIKKTDIETIVKSLKLYTAKQDSNFYANPATWLNADQWLDEYKGEFKAATPTNPSDFKKRYGVDKLICDKIKESKGNAWFKSFIEDNRGIFSDSEKGLTLSISTGFSFDMVLDACADIFHNLGYDNVWCNREDK